MTEYMCEWLGERVIDGERIQTQQNCLHDSFHVFNWFFFRQWLFETQICILTRPCVLAKSNSILAFGLEALNVASSSCVAICIHWRRQLTLTCEYGSGGPC